MKAETAAASVAPNIGSNAATQMGARILYMLTRLAVPPAVLSHVSLAEYGIWSVCFIVISYLGMSAFGISNVYIRQVAHFNATGGLSGVNQLLSTGLALTLPAVALLMALLWWLVPTLIETFAVAPALAETASFLILGTALVFCLDLSLGAFAYIMHGLQLIARHTAIWTFSFLVELALIMLLLHAGFGIYSLLIAFAARYALSIALSALACFRALPGLSIRPRHVRRAMVRQFTGFGAVVQLTGVLSILLNSIEKMVAGAFLGVQATGLFEIGQKLPIMGAQITSSLNTVFLPAAAHLHSSANKEALWNLYLRGSRYVSLLNGFIMGFLAAFAPYLLRVWIGDAQDLSQAAFLMALFTLPNHLHLLTGPGSAVHRGSGRPGRELRYPVFQGILAAAALGAAWLWNGLTLYSIGVAVAFAMGASALCYVYWTNRQLGLGQAAFWRKVLAPSLAPYGFGLALCYVVLGQLDSVALGRWELGAVLAGCAAAYSALNATAFWLLSCDETEKQTVRAHLTRLLNLRPLWLRTLA